MVDPENPGSLVAELEVFTGMKVEVVRATLEEIADTIRTCYGARD